MKGRYVFFILGLGFFEGFSFDRFSFIVFRFSMG